MRIGIVHMTTEETSGDYAQMVSTNLNLVKEESTKIDHRFVRHLRRATDSATAYPMVLNQADIIDEVVALAHDGADAVVIACAGDGAVTEARSTVDIPVVGPLEATLGIAIGYGWKFGVVTVDDRAWATHLDQLVHAYGFGGRYIGTERMKTPIARVFTEGFSNPQLVLDDLTERGRELVDKGADVILIGSGGLCAFATSGGLSRVGELDVPVLDTVAVGLKVAEMRAALTHGLRVPVVSRAGWTARFPDRDRERVNRVFGR
ncbi:aspartate/glutamate racemase family protein [Streptomyces nigra]|uniref:aspartate/glutamate racemase family protein n=1 Tax=Streptomyces nigra TaxID=1827580 RepID=UPI003669E58B